MSEPSVMLGIRSAPKKVYTEQAKGCSIALKNLGDLWSLPSSSPNSDRDFCRFDPTGLADPHMPSFLCAMAILTYRWPTGISDSDGIEPPSDPYSFNLSPSVSSMTAVAGVSELTFYFPVSVPLSSYFRLHCINSQFHR